MGDVVRCVLQRVRSAAVRVDGEPIARIDHGILALVAVLPDDDERDVEYIADRLLNLRIFADEAGRMNLSVQQADGSLLLVSQFTLAADTRRGRRPSFSSAAPPAVAEQWFDELVARVRQADVVVQTGAFGASMDVELINDGPVTLLVDSADRRRTAGPEAASGKR